jgi:outer membrane protein
MATLVFAAPAPVGAETLNGALTKAYRANPVLNSDRAGVRAQDENVPRALSQLRPRVKTDTFLGAERRRSVNNATDINNGDYLDPVFTESIQNNRGAPRSAILSVEQPLFDGLKAINSTRAAEANVYAARQRLRLTESRVLLDVVSAYMNVMRDTAILRLHESNVSVLGEQLRQVKERYAAGQITLTDIAQAEARLSAGRAQAAAARATMEASIGTYKKVVGDEPNKLVPASPIDNLLPKTREEAERIALVEHPIACAALHDADAADLQVLVAEGDFMPTFSLVGNVYTQSDIDGRGNRAVGAQVLGKLSIPLYSGGETSARVRQAKETAGQKKFDVDVARAELMSLVRANWGSLEAAKAQVTAAQAQVKAAERALTGVREEAKAGQRTTLDILNAQYELLGARIGLVLAQRDRVVASYGVMAAAGRLSAATLGLKVEEYDAGVHFDQVKDLWFGPDTPGATIR